MNLTCNHKDDGGRRQDGRGQGEQLVEHVEPGHGWVSVGDQRGRAQQVHNVGHGGWSPSTTLQTAKKHGKVYVFKCNQKDIMSTLSGGFCCSWQSEGRIKSNDKGKEESEMVAL